MKEVAFIRQNIDKWRGTEVLLKTLSTRKPDELADAYVEVTSDLAFSQSHYPRSRITLYLNGLASSLHQAIYRNRRERWTRIITFWSREVPATMNSGTVPTTIFKPRRAPILNDVMRG